jgi:hypothetical protein
MGASACSEGSSSDRDTSTGGSDSGDGGASDGSGGSGDQGGADNQGGGGPTGSGGSSSGDLTPFLTYTFDADLEGFEIGWAESGGAQDTELQDATTITWDSANGNPDPGAMSSTSPFDGPEHRAQLQVTLGTAEDLTGGMVTAWIRLESGLTTDPANPGGAKLFVKDSAWVWASGPWENLVEGEWVELTLNAAVADYEDAGFDPSQIMQVGVEYETGGVVGDFWTEATVTVDSIELSRPAE